MSKLIFISHIHEEREMAVLIKEALEDEFSGFVDVFVSSDGTSIPAGANFLKRIEDALCTCVGALYLISPKSVSRQWINFELGAVWIRNALSIRSGGSEIPALPVCHSGSAPNTLPAPLNNLNGILAADSAKLEFAFRSIQAAVGGKGRLKTDFDELARKISDLERSYTEGANVKRLTEIVGASREQVEMLIQVCKSAPGSTQFLKCGWIDNQKLEELRFIEKELRGQLTVITSHAGLGIGRNGASAGAELEMTINADLMLRCESDLLR
jgi:hypothetical protein